MPNAFETAFDTYAIASLNRSFGVSVTAERGGNESSAFTARRGMRDHEQVGANYGILTTIKRRYYQFDKDDYDFGSGAVEPEFGDRITEGSEVYEIMPPNDDTPAVEEVNGGLEWLVHCKKVE